MVFGFTYLIQKLEKRQKIDIEGLFFYEMLGGIIEGTTIEPEKFPEFVKAYEDMLTRLGCNIKNIRARLFIDISIFTFMADHSKSEVMDRSPGDNKISDYYKDPLLYGKAMNLFAEYVGLKGRELYDYILNPPTLH